MPPGVEVPGILLDVGQPLGSRSSLRRRLAHCPAREAIPPARDAGQPEYGASLPCSRGNGITGDLLTPRSRQTRLPGRSRAEDLASPSPSPPARPRRRSVADSRAAPSWGRRTRHRRATRRPRALAGDVRRPVPWGRLAGHRRCPNAAGVISQGLQLVEEVVVAGVHEEGSLKFRPGTPPRRQRVRHARWRAIPARQLKPASATSPAPRRGTCPQPADGGSD